MSIKYKLIAVDLDGTLLNPAGELDERNITAAKAAMRLGAKFVISSGRMPGALMNFARAIGINAPVVCFNGGAVVDVFDNRVLYKTPILLPAAIELARAAEERGLYMHAFSLNGYRAPYYCDKTEAYERLSGVKANVLNANISDNLNEAPMKLLIIDAPETAPEHERALQERFMGRASIMRSQKHFIECVAANAGKAQALGFLAEHLGIPPAFALAFGDGPNDVDMLNWAGTSYVMQNAPESVRAASPRFITAPSNARCGVARVLESLMEQGLIGG